MKGSLRRRNRKLHILGLARRNAGQDLAGGGIAGFEASSRARRDHIGADQQARRASEKGLHRAQGLVIHARDVGRWARFNPSGHRQ